MHFFILHCAESHAHGHWLFKISGLAQVCITGSPSTQSQRTQNAAHNKKLAPETQWTNTVELQCVHLLLALLNSKIVPNQNQSDHVQFYKLHFLSKVWRWKALWKSINIQQTIFLGPNECKPILIKNAITGSWFESKTGGKGSSWGAQHPVKSFSGNKSPGLQHTQCPCSCISYKAQIPSYCLHY